MRRIWKRHSMGGADEKKKSKSIFASVSNVNADLFIMEQYIICKSRK